MVQPLSNVINKISIRNVANGSKEKPSFVNLYFDGKIYFRNICRSLLKILLEKLLPDKTIKCFGTGGPVIENLTALIN